MAQNISPGVYTKIIDLSQYLSDIPGTIGFIPFLSRRGPDNKVVYNDSHETYFTKYGRPNIMDYGKNYGQGPYIASNHLRVATSLYTIRCLPDDATYANLFLVLEYADPSDPEMLKKVNPDEPSVPVPPHIRMKLVPFGGVYTDHEGIVRSNDMTSVSRLNTRLNTELIDTWNANGLSNGFLAYFRPIGRGDSYNDFAITISRHVNNELFGVYVLNIYETQNDGNQVVVESFNVTFDPNTVDDSGDSLYIEDVVNRYSKYLRVQVNPRALEILNSHMPEYYNGDPTQPSDSTRFEIDLTNPSAPQEIGYKAFIIQERTDELESLKDDLQTALDQLAVARSMPQGDVSQVTARNSAIRAAILSVNKFRGLVQTAKRLLEDAQMLDILATVDYVEHIPVTRPISLSNGSEGSLWSIEPHSGRSIVNPDIAKQILAEAYSGLLIDPETSLPAEEMLDTEDHYITLVYDGGYPDDVKTQAINLVEDYRRDCVLIMDNGDNPNYDWAIVHARDLQPMNSRYVARYEPYNKIYDVHTGRDIWISPVYHMASIIPMTDALYELWYAPAGFNRATIDDIKELRYNSKIGVRDQLYQLQVNPIVKFNPGYTVWGQLTTQKRPSSLQDLNVMRMVLYIKRAIEQFCKYFIFEFNDSATWDQIRNEIVPFLETIKTKRGLQNYNVEVGATEWEYKNKICHVNVTLWPTKVIEKIELNLYVR